MSNQQHTPGRGIHPEDLSALTEYWHRETNYINEKVDEAFKSAQDSAYARGYRRGREDLIEIRNQRDELLAALEGMVDAFDHRNDSPKNLEKHRCSALVCARAAIASVKGGAA